MSAFSLQQGTDVHAQREDGESEQHPTAIHSQQKLLVGFVVSHPNPNLSSYQGSSWLALGASRSRSV